MKLLVVGGGGREHALAWKLAASPRVTRVYVAPGNGGTARDRRLTNVPITAIDELADFAAREGIAFTVVGPEAPLAAGIVDVFRARGLRIFGPTREAARLESSKDFAKSFMKRHGIPTAEYRTFTDAFAARRYVEERGAPIVVKADGLAAGKGVSVCAGRDEALAAVDQIARQKVFGSAGDRIVIEERLDGQEASVLALVDGETIVTLSPAQDHKPAWDGDRGPNTGGMGAYCPAPVVDDATLHWVEERILVPTVHAMKRARRPFRGVLYAGLMMTRQGPKVLEYNVRFGDPECQPLLMRLRTDLVDLLEATVEGKLDRFGTLDWDPRPAVCVVMASEGYPGKYTTGHPIRGLSAAEQLPDVKVFHSGTAVKNDQVVTAGGRVLSVTALGANIAQAKLQAYRAVKCIRWRGAWCRKDIADKAIRS